MEQKITPLKVMGVVVLANAALKNKDFNTAEVMIGLAELTGRTIVDMANTQVGADTLIQHAYDHLINTVRIGMTQKGHPLGTAKPS